MILGLSVIAVVAVLWCLTALPARPMRVAGPEASTPRKRALERRDERLRLHPEQATVDDVARLLAGRVTAADAERVLARAAHRALPASLAWTWATRYGARELVLAIDAEVTQRSMERHLSEGCEPDWHGMEVLAGLARDPDGPDGELTYPPDLGDWSVGESLAGPDDIDLSGFGKLPPIAGPARLSAPSEHWDPDEVTSVEAELADDGAEAPPPTEKPDPDQRPGGGHWPLAS